MEQKKYLQKSSRFFIFQYWNLKPGKK